MLGTFARGFALFDMGIAGDPAAAGKKSRKSFCQQVKKTNDATAQCKH